MLGNAFKGTKTRFCVVSFTSDWLYPTRESREIVQALNAVAANVSFVEVESDKGHDAFLLDEPPPVAGLDRETCLDLLSTRRTGRAKDRRALRHGLRPAEPAQRRHVLG